MEYTEILIDIRKIVRAINLESKKIQAEIGLSIPQTLALTYLSKKDDYQCSQLELRKYLQLNSSTVTGIVSRLEKKGLLAKLPPKGDKRSTWLSLTASGLQILEKSPMLLHEKLKQRLHSLSAEDFESIRNGLNMLVQVLDVQDLDAGPILTITDPSSNN